MDTFDVLFNVASFLASLSLLERGAKLFVSSVTTLARRLRLSEVLVAILIAGAEWEELAVVALSLAQRRPALAVGNVIGSSIANIFGAFALGLIFSTSTWEGFDGSSKRACAGLLLLTSVVSLFALADILWNRVVASFLLATFIFYVLFVLWTVWCCMFYTGNNEEEDDIESGPAAHDDLDDVSSVSASSTSAVSYNDTGHNSSSEEDTTERSPLLPSPAAGTLKNIHYILKPILKVLCGFVCMTISGFILSHTSAKLADAFDMSDSAFGATILSLATTLPEKVLAIASSTQGHTGLLVADAVGSNVFLLTLCLGLTAWSVAAHDWHSHPIDGRLSLTQISRIEAWWLWAAAAALMLVVVVGGTGACKVAGVRQVLGALMLMAYGGFLAVELTILRT